MNLDSAVDAALEEMPDDYIIKPFLLGNRAEVKKMLLTEYNEEKVMQQEREEGRQEGRQEGLEAGRQEVAAELLKEGGMTASLISKMTHLSEETVRKLANTLGVSVL